MENIIKGMSVSKGQALGSCVILQDKTDIETIQITEDKVQEEKNSFLKMKDLVLSEINELIEKVRKEQDSSFAEIFEAHKEMVEDIELEEEVYNIISNEHISSINAICNYFDTSIEEMLAIEDEYLKERASEFKDLKQHFINAYLGNNGDILDNVKSDQDVIIVAEDLTPSQTAKMDCTKVKGFVLELGGKTSHVAILAKTMGIPALMGVQNVTSQVKNGDILLLDGKNSQAVINPNDEKTQEYKVDFENALKLNEYYESIKEQNAITKDGKTVFLFSNIGGLSDLPLIKELRSQGVGLMRTEFLFMSYTKEPPSEDTQTDIYSKVRQALGTKPLIIRLLDIGGDKELPYMNFTKEDNPFLGYRGVRIYKDHLDIFKSQIRAIIRATEFGHIHIMIPMISFMEEFLWVKKQILEEEKNLANEGYLIDPRKIKIGLMIETPAAAVMSQQFADVADFFSIGTNDLTQYSLAVDRGNDKISNLYNHLHPAVFHLIKIASDNAYDRGIEIGICGELGSDPYAIPLLVGMRIDELSISGKAIHNVKDIILNCNYEDCKKLVDDVLTLNTPNEVRKKVKEFAIKHNLPIE